MILFLNRRAGATDVRLCGRNRVPSSRRLERECQRNIELVWLTGQLAPDFKTIADFRKGVVSVLPFIPFGMFDEATIRTIGHAFDAACKELHDTGQPAVVHEVMIKRIIAAIQKGERNAARLRDAALTGLRKPSNQVSRQVALSGAKRFTSWRRRR
jgi:hypothetical protein